MDYNYTMARSGLFDLEEDPRSKGWFLIDSPGTVTSIVIAYLLFVTKVGPAMMRNRKGLQLKEFMMFYNVFQIIYCSALVVTSLVPFTWFSPSCATLSFSEEYMIYPKLSYAFFLLKVIDLLDTIVFVLRKKDNQVSFLHIFHHVYVVVLGYMHTKYLAGSQIPLLTFCNGIVHVLMYYYYMKTSITKKALWWKKYLTSLQLIQLGIMTTCMIPTMLKADCKFPKFPVFGIMFMPTSVLIFEFAKFYVKSYTRTPKEAKSRQ